MELLELVRGPLLYWSFFIMVVGVVWRAGVLLLRPGGKDHSAHREGAPGPAAGALWAIIRKMWPGGPFQKKLMLHTVIGYTWHLTWFGILFFGTPHILFLGDFLGFTWPGLPKGIIDVFAGVTLGVMLIALFLRILDPVRRLISGFEDYFSWFVTFLPVLTGVMVTSGIGARYELLLVIHILSVELLMVWLPFGKLFHSVGLFLGRAVTGARFAHRGARV